MEEDKPFSPQTMYLTKSCFLQAPLTFSSRKQKEELKRGRMHGVWLKTTTLRERFRHSLTHGVASLSALLPKSFQEKPVMDEWYKK